MGELISSSSLLSSDMSAWQKCLATSFLLLVFFLHFVDDHWPKQNCNTSVSGAASDSSIRALSIKNLSATCAAAAPSGRSSSSNNAVADAAEIMN
jgi:hypothetical protein